MSEAAGTIPGGVSRRSATPGDKVTVHYIGTLDNGHIFDQADEDSPLSFTIGAEEIFPSLEKEIVGMAVGEVKNIELKAEDAYGPRRRENMLLLDRNLFPAKRVLQIGEKLSIELADGSKPLMRVREVEKTTVLLDGNHDLAGCNLTFALKIVEIE